MTVIEFLRTHESRQPYGHPEQHLNFNETIHHIDGQLPQAI